MYRVQAGDTLGLISFRELGDATRWRSIADANRLMQVRALTPGTVLVIPNE
jgi:nucleoid-associated protein YgaU